MPRTVQQFARISRRVETSHVMSGAINTATFLPPESQEGLKRVFIHAQNLFDAFIDQNLKKG